MSKNSDGCTSAARTRSSYEAGGELELGYMTSTRLGKGLVSPGRL